MALILPIVLLYVVVILLIELSYGWAFRLYEYTKGFLFPSYKVKGSVKSNSIISPYLKLRKIRTRNMVLRFNKSLVTLVLLFSLINVFYYNESNPIDSELDNIKFDFYLPVVLGGLGYLIVIYLLTLLLIKPHSDFNEKITVKLFLSAVFQWETLLFLRNHGTAILKFRDLSGNRKEYQVDEIVKIILVLTLILIGLRVLFKLIYTISPIPLPMTKTPYHLRIWNGKKLIKFNGSFQGSSDKITILLHGFAVNYKSWLGKITDEFQEVKPPEFLASKTDQVFALNFSDYLKNGLLQKSWAFNSSGTKIVNQAVNHYEWELAYALNQLVKTCNPSQIHIITHSTSGVVSRSLFTGDNKLLFQELGISGVAYEMTMLAAPNKGAKGGSSVILSNLLMLNFNVVVVNTTKALFKLLPFIRKYVEPFLDYVFGNGLMGTLINCQTPIDLHPKSQYMAQLNKNKKIDETGGWLILFDTLLNVKWRVGSARYDRVIGTGGNITFDDIRENDKIGVSIQYANFRADHDNLIWEELEQIGMKVPAIKTSKLVLEWIYDPEVLSHSGNRPLNNYKFKSSHNSYSDSALSTHPTVEVTKELLKNNFRSIELDITRDILTKNLIVAHFDGILNTEDPFSMYAEEIASFYKVKSSQNLFDTMFLLFDTKKTDSNTIKELAETLFKGFDALNDDGSINHSKANQLFISSSELPPVKANWPTFSECKNRIILGMHLDSHKKIPEEFRTYFVTDDKYAFSNYNYFNLRIPVFSYFKRRSLRKDLRKGKIVRVFPPLWNGFFGIFRNIFGMSLDFCIKLNAQMISVDGQKRQDISELFRNYSFLVEYSFKD